MQDFFSIILELFYFIFLYPVLFDDFDLMLLSSLKFWCLIYLSLKVQILKIKKKLFWIMNLGAKTNVRFFASKVNVPCTLYLFICLFHARPSLQILSVFFTLSNKCSGLAVRSIYWSSSTVTVHQEQKVLIL